MKVAIGTGKMARGFATALAAAREVTIGSRDPSRAERTAAETGAARGATYAAAADGAQVVILTVPWNAMEETLGQLGELKARSSSTSPIRTRRASMGPAGGGLG